MERLTNKDYEKDRFYLNCDPECTKASCEKCSTLLRVVERLAIIEDILGDDYNLDRLKELAEADRDGRCLVPPVKVGQTVWFVRDPKRNPNKTLQTKVEKIVYKNGGAYLKLGCNSLYETACSSIGKTVFLTQEGGTALRSDSNE